MRFEVYLKIALKFEDHIEASYRWGAEATAKDRYYYFDAESLAPPCRANRTGA